MLAMTFGDNGVPVDYTGQTLLSRYLMPSTSEH